jgi:hypothetical protein
MAMDQPRPEFCHDGEEWLGNSTAKRNLPRIIGVRAGPTGRKTAATRCTYRLAIHHADQLHENGDFPKSDDGLPSPGRPPATSMLNSVCFPLFNPFDHHASQGKSARRFDRLWPYRPIADLKEMMLRCKLCNVEGVSESDIEGNLKWHVAISIRETLRPVHRSFLTLLITIMRFTS